MDDKSNLLILQYNVVKSKGQSYGQLRDERIGDFDIIAIQELWRNPYFHTTHYPCSRSFHLLYPDDPEVRACSLVNGVLASVSEDV